MQSLTPVGQNIVNDIASRYNLSFDSTVNMLAAVNRGGGSMAQFSCPELGSGQWMRGGMTMVGDMFNHGLKNTVNNLCVELSNALANNQMFPPAKSGGAGGGNNWWPGNLGSPSSSGSQNNIRYAFFPQAQRLVVERNGGVTVFNTLNHHISGVSQQQGGNTSLTFSSQFGTISTLNLPMVSGPGLLPQEEKSHTNFADPHSQQSSSGGNQQQQSSSGGYQSQSTGNPGQQSQSSDQPFGQQSERSGQQSGSPSSQSTSEIMDLLGNLGKLRDSGVLTDDEFNSKKAELLKRL